MNLNRVMTAEEVSMTGFDLTIVADILERVRTQRPRVHCLTNPVAQNLTANMLLAIGATPSMTEDAREVAAFVASANVLLVNLGQLNAGREAGIMAAVQAAQSHAIPWLLDPVMIDRSPMRAAFATQLLAFNPAMIRANAAEWGVLTSLPPQGEAVKNIIHAQSGAVDSVCAHGKTLYIQNGHEYMSRITAMGCAGTAVMAACCAVHKNAFEAAVAAFAILGIAGEIAAKNAHGVGTFVPAYLDALANLTPNALHTLGRIT